MFKEDYLNFSFIICPVMLGYLLTGAKCESLLKAKGHF